jgi:hypothetical protein
MTTRLHSSNRRVEVEVTEAVIAKAVPVDSAHCMISDAIRAAHPEFKGVATDLATIRFTDPAKRQRYIYLTPLVAVEALSRFDAGDHIEPFKFSLKAPVQVVESGGRTSTKSKISEGASSTRRQGVVVTSRSTVPTVLGGAPRPMGVLTDARGRIRRYGRKALRWNQVSDPSAT